MNRPYYVVDAFSHLPFAGNSAGVCPLEEPADEGWMQAIAAEMMHAETAFLWPEGDGYRLRWFTPTVEVDLCGHATLACAKVLLDRGDLVDGDNVVFHTLSGELTAGAMGASIRLDFPAEAADRPSRLPAAYWERVLGAGVVHVAENRMDVLVHVTDETSVRSLKPDIAEIAKVDARGVIVTAYSPDPELDFVSRFFAPAAGVPEDPVTGSAHCCLGPYWGEKLGRLSLVGYQASARGGIVRVELVGDRVHLIGDAVLVLEGVLRC